MHRSTLKTIESKELILLKQRLKTIFFLVSKVYLHFIIYYCIALILSVFHRTDFVRSLSFSLTLSLSLSLSIYLLYLSLPSTNIYHVYSGPDSHGNAGGVFFEAADHRALFFCSKASGYVAASAVVVVSFLLLFVLLLFFVISEFP